MEDGLLVPNGTERSAWVRPLAVSLTLLVVLTYRSSPSCLIAALTSNLDVFIYEPESDAINGRWNLVSRPFSRWTHHFG